MYRLRCDIRVFIWRMGQGRLFHGECCGIDRGYQAVTSYMLINLKSGVWLRYLSEGQAVNAARAMGWTDYVIERIEG